MAKKIRYEPERQTALSKFIIANNLRMSDCAKATGLTQSIVSRTFHGRAVPSLDNAVKMVDWARSIPGAKALFTERDLAAL